MIDNTAKDSFELYRGLYAYNPHSEAQLIAFKQAFISLQENLEASTEVQAHNV